MLQPSSRRMQFGSRIPQRGSEPERYTPPQRLRTPRRFPPRLPHKLLRRLCHPLRETTHRTHKSHKINTHPRRRLHARSNRLRPKNDCPTTKRPFHLNRTYSSREIQTSPKSTARLLRSPPRAAIPLRPRKSL